MNNTTQSGTVDNTTQNVSIESTKNEIDMINKWETEVKEKLNEYIDNMLAVSKDCNMQTKYFHPVKEIFEDHTEYDETKICGAELKIIVTFVDNIDKSKIVFM